MKLKKVVIKKFKAVDEIHVNLSSSTLLVGQNNAGKSSVLQAIHFASRLLNLAPEANKQSTVSLREVEYIPTEEYKKIGFNKDWGNQKVAPQSEISLEFESDDAVTYTAKVILKSARNEGISIDPTIPTQLMSLFRGPTSVVSAYIPGVAGIPLKEEKLSKRLVYRKAASGDSNVILRNVLLLLKSGSTLTDTIHSLRDLYDDQGIDITVNFDENKDYYIQASFIRTGMESHKPLELAGTGFIQALQIFSYLYLFTPKIILLDEPEAHLHPPLQTRLVEILQQRAVSTESVVLISTHSPFVAAGLQGDANTIWLDSGKVAASSSDQMLRDAVGWGALDKKCLICSEDGNLKPINNIISQDVQTKREVGCIQFSGLSKLPTPEGLHAFRSALGNRHKIACYRDRDGLTDKEIERWSKPYLDKGINVLVSDGSDIESYFCSSALYSEISNLTLDEAKTIISEIFEENRDQFEKKFTSKRQDVNKKMNADGGAPATQYLIENEDIYRIALGKDLLSKINDRLQADGHKAINKSTSNFEVIVGESLIESIKELIN